MNTLQAAYEKTSLHRLGIPLERSLARLPWLRAMLEASARRSQQPDVRRPERQP